ncbi:MAG: hypothetical protein Q4P72_03395 [Eubacteriales bacterium]|nr:hypothetical protein [Eubacteriales bacterium]
MTRQEFQIYLRTYLKQKWHWVYLIVIMILGCIFINYLFTDIFRTHLFEDDRNRSAHIPLSNLLRIEPSLSREEFVILFSTSMISNLLYPLVAIGFAIYPGIVGAYREHRFHHDALLGISRIHSLIKQFLWTFYLYSLPYLFCVAMYSVSVYFHLGKMPKFLLNFIGYSILSDLFTAASFISFCFLICILLKGHAFSIVIAYFVGSPSLLLFIFFSATSALPKNIISKILYLFLSLLPIKHNLVFRSAFGIPVRSSDVFYPLITLCICFCLAYQVLSRQDLSRTR